MKNRLILLFTTFALLIAYPPLVFADAREGCGDTAINTAIGCVPFGSIPGLVGFILRWAIGIAGGAALGLMVWAGFKIITSSGDPKKAQSGKELLTAAIAGILFLLFSIFVLRVVGLEILEIPGL